MLITIFELAARKEIYHREKECPIVGEMVNALLQNNLRVVYYDERYPTNWIHDDKSKIIADYLEKHSFIKVNADDLKDWMEATSQNRDIDRSVVVMSQDVAPVTVYPDYQLDCLVCRFLNAGGRIVWMGDIPFYWFGKTERDLHRPELNLYKPVPLDEKSGTYAGDRGQYVILGSVSAHLISSKDATKLIRHGKKFGIMTTWYSGRPVKRKYLGWKGVLARTKIRPRVHIDDIDPQRLDTEINPKPITSITTASQITDSTGRILFYIGTILSLIVLISSSTIAVSADRYIAVSLSGIILSILVLFSIWNWNRNRFASAWVARFGKFRKKGEFVRIWDYGNISVDSNRLDELYNIATHERKQS